MPIKVTRRPYTECAWQWFITVDGVASGDGDASDSICNSLNGTFALDFKACVSTGNLLVWEYACRSYDIKTTPCYFGSCASTFIANEIPWSGAWPVIPDGLQYTVTKPFEKILRWSETLYQETGCCAWQDSEDYWFTVHNKADIPFIPDDNRCWLNNEDGTFSASVTYVATITASQCNGCSVLFVITKNVNGLSGIIPGRYTTLETRYDTSPFECLADHTYDLTTYINTGNPFEDGVSLCGGVPLLTDSPFLWTNQVSVTMSDVVTGVDTNNSRFKTDWHLEYNISKSKWLLRSFAVIGYPQYELEDSDPCVGDEKVLSRVIEDGDSGCQNSPPTVTITRVCPPDAEETAFPRKLNKRTGKSHRLCGCDCQDQVVDLRWKCEENCESTASAGCETWSEDQIECKYPASSDACTYCEEDKAPCAYEVMFECDIEHEGVSIAAKTVTLRHKCYFEKGKECDWVAIGPSANAEDGPTGKQPVCARCGDPCLSGCSWDAWKVSPCPTGDCGESLCDTTETFTLSIGATYGQFGTECTAAQDITLEWARGSWTNTDGSGLSVLFYLGENCVALQVWGTASCDGAANIGVVAYTPDVQPTECPTSITLNLATPTYPPGMFPDTVTITKN